MYQEHGGFDESLSSNISFHGGGGGQVGFSQTLLHNSMEMQSAMAAAALEMELQQHLEIEQCFNGASHHHLQQQQQNMISTADQIYSEDFLMNMFHIQPPPPLPPFHYTHGHAVDADRATINGDVGAAVFEFGQNSKNGRKQCPSEKHRRARLTDRYEGLKSLLPTPTKKDRASILSGSISYIKELKRTRSELKSLVEQKRFAMEKLKMKPKQEEEVEEGNNINGPSSISPLRSSWLHRKSNNTEVDVRIIDDEVTVKLVQQKRINCLVFVSKVLEEFELDLHHVAGGLIGDYYSYLFNSKICEGSSSIVYASAVANKVLEVVDNQYAAFPPTTTY